MKESNNKILQTYKASIERVKKPLNFKIIIF